MKKTFNALTDIPRVDGKSIILVHGDEDKSFVMEYLSTCSKKEVLPIVVTKSISNCIFSKLISENNIISDISHHNQTRCNAVIKNALISGLDAVVIIDNTAAMAFTQSAINSFISEIQFSRGLTIIIMGDCLSKNLRSYVKCNVIFYNMHSQLQTIYDKYIGPEQISLSDLNKQVLEADRDGGFIIYSQGDLSICNKIKPKNKLENIIELPEDAIYHVIAACDYSNNEPYCVSRVRSYSPTEIGAPISRPKQPVEEMKIVEGPTTFKRVGFSDFQWTNCFADIENQFKEINNNSMYNEDIAKEYGWEKKKSVHEAFPEPKRSTRNPANEEYAFYPAIYVEPEEIKKPGWPKTKEEIEKELKDKRGKYLPDSENPIDTSIYKEQKGRLSDVDIGKMIQDIDLPEIDPSMVGEEHPFVNRLFQKKSSNAGDVKPFAGTDVGAPVSKYKPPVESISKEKHSFIETREKMRKARESCLKKIPPPPPAPLMESCMCRKTPPTIQARSENNEATFNITIGETLLKTLIEDRLEFNVTIKPTKK